MPIFATQLQPRVIPFNTEIKETTEILDSEVFQPAIAIQTFVQVYGPFADAVSPHAVSRFISTGPYSLVFA